MKRIIYQSIGLYLNTLNKISPKKGGEVGYRLFCKPGRSKLKRQHKEFFDTSDQEDFDFNGVNIRLYSWGQGPKKVLFVHGWQSHSYRWKQFIALLPKDEYTLIAFDAPGHGQSGGDQFHVPMNAFLISLLVEKYGGFDAVVAHSIGSFSVLYAKTYYHINKIGKFVSMASPSRAAEFFAFYSSALQLKKHTMDNVTNVFQMQVRHKVEDISLATFARFLDIPGLIIHDKNDPETPYANALEMAEVWVNSELITTNGFGHNLKSPNVVRLVVDYLR
ncbi:alpha/beta fold hydrolase [Aquiflexum lacus]|uniref:alpha/beta fold hydrolase n=1 Tax=Aquiflexum lacus TaxID=2483805 RepID=UPI001894390F|nr:alpha/beta hydrolase [Aquiflexum lacus]